jgi:hypothetical protein
MRPFGVAIVTLCVLAACGRDPILKKAEADAAARRARAAESGAGAPPPSGGPPGGPPGADAGAGAGVPGAAQPGDPSGGPAGAVGPDGQPIPGVAEPPAPGDPSIPPPGGAVGDPTLPPPGGAVGVPSQPLPGGAPPPAGGAPLGPTVAVSGTIEYAAWKAGSIRITAFDGDHAVTSGKRPNVVGFGEIARPGPFTLNVTENAGKVYVEATLDEDGDGRPGPLDPQGKPARFPVTVGTEPITGLAIALKRRDPPPGGRGEDF